MIVVSDTSVIYGLFVIEKLELLERLYNKIVIPEAVYEELLKFKSYSSKVSALKNLKWIKVAKPTNLDLLIALRKDLDIGEAEAITLAKELYVDFLLIDEIKGRKIAKQMGLKIIGLLGILTQAKNEGLVRSVKQLMDELKIKANFWISSKLYNKVLEITNEI